MTVNMHLELWHVITLLLAVLGAAVGYGKVLLGLYEKRLNERFRHLEELRGVDGAQWEERLGRLEMMCLENARSMAHLQAELPLHYQRREDAVRGESILHAKLDALAGKIDTLLMGGRKHGSE